MRNALHAALAAVVIMSWCSSGAWAQAASSATPTAAQQSDENQLVEVLVTAQRRVETVSDVPLSMSVYSSDDLFERNIVTTADLVKFTPVAGGFPAASGGPEFLHQQFYR